jgi:hypothetical protein
MNSIQYGDQRFHADIRFMVFLSAYSKTLGIGVVAEDKSQDTHVFNDKSQDTTKVRTPTSSTMKSCGRSGSLRQIPQIPVSLNQL